jgi:hypothetical protein
LQDNLAGFAPHPARPFDIDAVTGIVTKCAKRQLRLFIHCRDIDLDDLVSEGVAAAAKVHPKYNPAKGAYTTWVYRAARSRMIDIARSRTRQAKREDVAARDARDRHAFIEHPEIHVEEQGQDLAEWLANVYRAIKAVRTLYTPPPPTGPRRRGRPHGTTAYSAAQVMALTALQRRERLSSRRLVNLLDRRPELRDAIGLRKTPACRTLELRRKSENLAQLIPTDMFGDPLATNKPRRTRSREG